MCGNNSSLILKNLLLQGPFKRPADLSSHSSSGSFHAGRGPAGTQTSCGEKPSSVYPQQQPKLFPHTNPGPCREDGFGSGHPIEPQSYSDPQFPSLPVSKGKANTEKEKTSRKKNFPPLCAARLKPIRQKTKNAVVSITFQSVCHVIIDLNYENDGYSKCFLLRSVSWTQGRCVWSC